MVQGLESLAGPITSRITVWNDPEPRAAAANMAMDEAMLRLTPGAAVRFYHWKNPSISFGYFQEMPPRLLDDDEETELVRRWTGGGTVDHRRDALTYCLAIPRTEDFWQISPEASYHRIHLALAAALAESGVHCHLAESSTEGTGLCFQGYVRWDVLGEDGIKISGAAQRRTRAGMLHQGSIQLKEIPDGFPELFASILGEESRNWEAPEPAFSEMVDELAVNRYGCATWTQRR